MPESYTFEDETLDLIRGLRTKFEVKTDAEVISRALALAKVISEQAGNADVVVVYGRTDP